MISETVTAFKMIRYSLLLISSIHKKNFSAIGRCIGKAAKYVAGLLQKTEENFEIMATIAAKKLADKKRIVITIDNTLIKKFYSKQIEGTGRWVDTTIRKKIRAYKMYTALFTDGKIALPFHAMFAKPDELLPQANESKYKWIKRIIHAAQTMFPDKEIILTADGEFSTIELLRWCKKNGIKTEMRMARNRKIFFKGKDIKISDIKEIKLRGRQEARTISVEWHGIPLFITATKLVSKNGTIRFVYQVSTFKAKPMEHVRIYKVRWTIEKSYRTAKQYLGLQDCISTSLDIQLRHASSVLLAYSLLQLECQYYRFESPEKAIRFFRSKNFNFLERRFSRWHQLFHPICA